MSDYIAELRRELVDAAGREQRRSAPRRALVRSRRPLFTALAGAAAATAVGLGILVAGRELSNPSPAGPRVVAGVRIGGVPAGAAPGSGAVWVAGDDGTVSRIDPDRKRVVATVDTGTAAPVVSASADAVWVLAAAAGRPAPLRLVRIDPASDRVVARIGSFGQVGAVLAAARAAAWVQATGRPPGPLRRVDAATNGITGPYGRRMLVAIAAGDERLWTLSWDGLLEWRDADTGRLLGRADGFAPDRPGGAYRSAILPGAGGAWVTTSEDGAVTRVGADGRHEWSVRVRANGRLALARGSLWVAKGDVTDRRHEILRLDPGDGRVTGRLALGARVPQALLEYDGDLWAVLSDGNALVIR